MMEQVQELVSARLNTVKMSEIRAVITEHPNELKHIKTAGKGRTKIAVLRDLEQWLNSPQTADSLYDKVKALVLLDTEKLRMRALRTLVKENSEELSHIKTWGKGRTKLAIIQDLSEWLKVQDASLSDDSTSNEYSSSGHDADSDIEMDSTNDNKRPLEQPDDVESPPPKRQRIEKNSVEANLSSRYSSFRISNFCFPHKLPNAHKGTDCSSLGKPIGVIAGGSCPCWKRGSSHSVSVE